MTINSTNYGYIRPGKGFKDALLAPVELKPFVSNENRLAHGTSVIVENAKKASRNLTLEFQVVGSTKSDCDTKLSALYTEFYKGTFVLSGLGFTDQVFHLVYTGKSPVYHSGLGMTICKVSAGFTEPDPSNRTANT